MVDPNRQPTAREIRVFGLLWLAFFGAVGALAVWRPEGLLVAAALLSGAWLASLAFNPLDRREQWLGFAMPALFGLAGGSSRLGEAPWVVGAALGLLALGGALAVWAAPKLGGRLYGLWMRAVLPIGWSVTQLILGLVYYLIVTPIGLILRATGYDPMRRRYDRAAPSYWVERRARRDAGSYFRQF